MNTLFGDEMNVVDNSPKSNEWYTPSKYIEAARTVMNGIDLDPASTALANAVVRASKFYTMQDNGLKQSWKADRVWLNPPYSSPDGTPGRTGSVKSSIKYFILRLLDEYSKGNIKQAILLVNSDTDASWFVPLWDYPICFANHKVMFHRPGKGNEGQFFGTCFVYLGPNEAKFVELFSPFGRIAKAIDTPKRVNVQPTLWDSIESEVSA